MTSEELKIDKRIVERNIKHGRLDAAEYQRSLSGLPDLSDKVWRKPHANESAPATASAVESEPPATAEVSSALPAQAPANYFSQG